MFKPFKALTIAGAMLSLAHTPAAAEPPPGAFADVQGGKLHYETCGSGPQAIVLLHDGVLDWAAWNDVWPMLCRDFRVVRYDRRGYGRSPEAKAPYSPLDDLGAVMRAAGLDHAAIVGSSSGGGIALDFALEHPQAVDRLVLVGPSVSGIPYSQHFLDRITALNGRLAHGDFMGAIKASWLLAPGHDADAQRVLKLLLANPQDLTHHDTVAPRSPAAPRLGTIKLPTLILVGEADVADNQAQAGALEYAIPHARRVVVPDAGHLMYLEHPQAFAKLVADFVQASGG